MRTGGVTTSESIVGVGGNVTFLHTRTGSSHGAPLYDSQGYSQKLTEGFFLFYVIQKNVKVDHTRECWGGDVNVPPHAHEMIAELGAFARLLVIVFKMLSTQHALTIHLHRMRDRSAC